MKSQARPKALPPDLSLHWPPPASSGHATIESNQRKTVMMNIVLALTLTLSAAALASAPVSAVEQEKDRCVLKDDSTDKIADCRKLPRKNASALDELIRKNWGFVS
jgi:predicted lipoprotein with Yx(FWY)xxD motif